MRELGFFGEVTAGVTHQIKNELAVINETGNLIVEIMAMAEMGREPDPGRIRELAQRVVNRVDRSNLMIKRLNTFAHSTEEEAGQTDLFKTLQLMTGLYERKAGFKKVSLAVEPPEEGAALEVRVKPFVLEQVLWAALEAAVGAAAPESLVRAALIRQDDGVSLRLEGQLTGELILPPKELLAQGKVTESAEEGVLILRFPG